MPKPRTIAVAKPAALTLSPLAVVEVPDERRAYLKLEGGVDGTRRVEWLPLAYLGQANRFAEFIANRFGYPGARRVREAPQIAYQSGKQSPACHRNLSARLDTRRRETFMYGPTPLPESAAAEFISPEGTALSEAAAAVTPRGSREGAVSCLSGVVGRIFPLPARTRAGVRKSVPSSDRRPDARLSLSGPDKGSARRPSSGSLCQPLPTPSRPSGAWTSAKTRRTTRTPSLASCTTFHSD